MSKYKVGDIVFDLRFGFGEIVQPNSDRGLGNLHVRFKIGKGLYLEDGRTHSTDDYPSLLTLEEAAKLGYYPEKKKVKKVLYQALLRDDVGGFYPHMAYFESEKHFKDNNSTDNFIRLLTEYPIEVEVDDE